MHSQSTYQSLLDIQAKKGAAFIVLIDPDKLTESQIPDFVSTCEASSVDGFFLGGSLIQTSSFDEYVKKLKNASSLPVIGFPGSLVQLSSQLDALLFLSLISGRNPEYLIGKHVIAAPLIKKMGIETIPTGYILVDSGKYTAANYMSHSLPIPKDKPDLAVATAMAGEMLGMKALFTDGGSGAKEPISVEMIQAITHHCNIPLIVGGGLKTPKQVSERVQAGASMIVVGNAFEKNLDGGYIRSLADACHSQVARRIEG